MKPYLYPNSTLAFVIEWGVLILSILLVFSPFIYLGIRKWKKHLLITWKQIFLAYLSSFVIYPIWDWWFLGRVDKWIYNSYINTHWLQEAITNPGFKMIFIVILGWPLLIFYVVMALKQGKFTLLNFIISLIVSIALFVALVIIWFNIMAIGLGYIGRTYF